MSPVIVNQKETLALLKKLVSVNSVNPDMKGPGEGEIAEVVYEEMNRMGVRVRRQRVAKDRFNIIGTLRGEGGGRNLTLNGHLDTVGVENMTLPPFRPVVKEGCLYGRGACDMKGPVAAMIAAARAILEAGVRLRGDLVLTFVVDEEYMSRGMEQLVRWVRADSAIVGEPTGLEVGVAHKGFVWLEAKCFGKPVHGSVPEAGIDAIMKMSNFLQGLRKLAESYRLRKHRLLGSPVIHTSMIEGGQDWAVVPGSCTLRFERRTLPGETPSDVVREIESVIGNVAARDPSFRGEARLVFHGSPMEIGRDEPIVKSLRKACVHVVGHEPKLVGMPFWTDAAILTDKAKTPSCLFGPGDIHSAHTSDENIELKSVYRAAEIYAATAMNFCGVV